MQLVHDEDLYIETDDEENEHTDDEEDNTSRQSWAEIKKQQNCSSVKPIVVDQARRRDTIQPRELVAMVRQTRLALQQYLRAYQDGEQHARKSWFNICCCFGNKSIMNDQLIDRAISLTDLEIRRFLRVCQYDVDKSVQRVVATLIWKHDQGVDTFLGDSSEFTAQDRCRSIYWAGKDLSNRPILVICMKRHKPNLFSAETTIRFILWKLEQKLQDPEVEDITAIFDLQGASMDNMDLSVLKLIIPTLYKFYPARFALGLFYSETTVNWLSFKVCSSMLNECTVKKLKFIHNSEAPSGTYFPFASLFGVGSHSDTSSLEKADVDDKVHAVVPAGRRVEMAQQKNVPPSVHAMFGEYISDENLECRFGGLLVVDENVTINNQETSNGELDIYHECMDIQEEPSARKFSLDVSDDPSEVLVSHQSASAKSLRVFGEHLQEIDAEEGLKNIQTKNRWAKIPASVFKLRVGPNYRANRKKEPSGSALYELLNVDYRSSKKKLLRMKEHLSIQVQQNGRGPENLPEYLVVTHVIPLHEPQMFGTSPIPGGKSVMVSALFRLSDWVRQNPDEVSVQMLSRFVHCFSGDPYRNRLKGVSICANPEQMEFSRVESPLFNRYNATPWLVKPRKNIHVSENFVEIDIDMHEFSYVTRRVTWSVTKRIDAAVLDHALIIQAETDEEMPERALCAYRTIRFQVNDQHLPEH